MKKINKVQFLIQVGTQIIPVVVGSVYEYLKVVRQYRRKYAKKVVTVLEVRSTIVPGSQIVIGTVTRG